MTYTLLEEQFFPYPWCQRLLRGLNEEARKKRIEITQLTNLEEKPSEFGCVLLIYGVFNVVFLPVFYKTAIRAGRAFLLAVIPMTVLMVLVEALSHFPVVGPYLDATDAAGQVRQLPVLAVGLAAFALLSWLAYRKAAKNYERVDL